MVTSSFSWESMDKYMSCKAILNRIMSLFIDALTFSMNVYILLVKLVNFYCYPHPPVSRQGRP